MTAIVGFTCHNSVLMIADTEETTSRYTKSSCHKLYRFNSRIGTAITGGAGDAHLIDCANQALQQYFAAGMPGTRDVGVTGQLIPDGLNSFAQKFFSETIEVYDSAALDPLPEMQLLIAVNLLKRRHFYSSSFGTKFCGSRHHIMSASARDFGNFTPCYATRVRSDQRNGALLRD